MIKKIEILGIQLDNYNIREAMRRVEAFLDDTTLRTIEEISMDTLVAAKEDEALKGFIEGLDLAVISDKEILREAGEDSSERMRETEERQFLAEFLKRVVRNGKSAYLFGETNEQLEELRGYLAENCGKLNLLGGFAMEDCLGDYDGAINEVNIASPDVVLSVLPSPEQEYFLLENRSKINTGIWVGLGHGYEESRGVNQIWQFFQRLVQKVKLRSMISDYEQEDKE